MEKVFKPSFIIANTAKLSSQQNYIYNCLLTDVYKQLEKNYLLNTFDFSIQFMKRNSNGRLDTLSKISNFFYELYKEEFEFNVLGKDKKIERNIKTRLITKIELIKEKNSIGLSLEPTIIEIMRVMIAKKQNKLPKEFEEKKITLNPYAYFENTLVKTIKFYPAQVIFELINDYKNFHVPLIDIETFKKITDTTEKYKKNYNNMVIKKSEKILNGLSEELNCKIGLIKEGRSNKWVKIESNINIQKETFKEFYKNLLKEGLKDTEQNKKIAQKTFNLKKGGNKK